MKRFSTALRRVLATTALAATLTGPACAAAMAAGWETVDALDHRLTIALPGAAKPARIGPARLNQPGEQRMNQAFDIEIGAYPVRVVVTEMLARSDQPIAQLGQLYAQRLVPAKSVQPPEIAVTASRPNGVDVATFTLEPSPKGFVKSAILRRPDNMLMRLDFHSDDAATAKAAEVAEATDAIVASLALGPRQLPAGKGVTLAHGELTLDLPPGYAAMEEARDSATLVNIMPILQPGQMRGTLSIYVGHDVRSCRPYRPDGTLKLFGRKGEWDVAESTDEWLQRDVCLLDPSDPYDAPQVKIRVQGPDARTERELIGILKTVRSKTLH